jgi:murein DD-endopeptidase MepM/ murein hydrolase activator NlpD
MRKNLLAVIVLALTVILAKGDPTVAMTRLADGFDFPVGIPNGEGYKKSRGFTVHGHLGEDWLREAGSGASFRDPVYAAGNGIVTLARDFRRAWGNVVVVRHAFMEEGQVKYADSLYAHLDRILVREGQQVARGQQVGMIGNCHGLYPAHLHFEFHKNLEIGVVHTLFAGDYSNYYSPTDFVNSHRSLESANRGTALAMNNYVMPTYAGIPALTPVTPATVANKVLSESKSKGNGFRVTRYEDFKD